MAGGLFGLPFVINMKCVIFSLICMALFLYRPVFKSNLSLYATLFFIFVVAYVAMAWYDFYYDCRIIPLKRGQYSITGLFKPSEKHKKNHRTENKDEELEKHRMKNLIYFSHILFITPLIAYVGIYKNKSNPLAFPLLVVLALFTFFYHAGHVVM